MKTKLVAIGAAGLLAAGATAFAVVGTAGAATGTIYGCVDNSGSRTLTNVRSTAVTCGAGETLITWQGVIGTTPPPTPSPTPTSPSPAPTSPSPTPTSTSSPGPVAAGNATCNYGPDTWSGDASSVGYSVTENSATNGKLASFSVNINANPGTTEVVGYPSDQCLLYEAMPASLSSSFDQTPPASSSGLDYEFAYDIWLTTAAKATLPDPDWSGDFELMIWTYVNGQVPAGSKVGTLADGSAVWVAGTPTAGTVSVVLPKNETSGTIDLASIISQLKTAGYITTADNGILDVEYGIEAPYGGGQTFKVNGFSVTGG